MVAALKACNGSKLITSDQDILRSDVQPLCNFAKQPSHGIGLIGEPDLYLLRVCGETCLPQAPFQGGPLDELQHLL